MRDNHLLGEFDFDGLPPMPRGKASIKVTCTRFIACLRCLRLMPVDIDSNGILKVSAFDPITKKSREITITNDAVCFIVRFLFLFSSCQSRLSDEQIEKMIAESARHKAEDEMNMKRVSLFSLFHPFPITSLSV